MQIGSIAVRSGDKIANRAYLIDPKGEIAASYDKLHLFDVDLPSGESWRESSTYSGGACAVVGGTELASIGLSICYDIRFPALYRALAEAGAEISPAGLLHAADWRGPLALLSSGARAIETGSFMISAAQGGKHEDGARNLRPLADRRSLVAHPRRSRDRAGVILAEIDLSKVADAPDPYSGAPARPPLHSRARRPAPLNQPRLRDENDSVQSGLRGRSRLRMLGSPHPIPTRRSGARLRRLPDLRQHRRVEGGDGADGSPVRPGGPALPVETPPPAEATVRMISEPERKMREMIKALHAHVAANSEHVGPRFAEEARKIHYGEAEGRSIHGQASLTRPER